MSGCPRLGGEIERDKWGGIAYEYRVSSWVNENFMDLGSSDGCRTL